jgi:hypothetical protein
MMTHAKKHTHRHNSVALARDSSNSTRLDIPYPEHVFYWESTGHALGPFTYWKSGYPDNDFKGESCIALFPGQSYQWQDYHCSESMRYICEKRGSK